MTKRKKRAWPHDVMSNVFQKEEKSESLSFGARTKRFMHGFGKKQHQKLIIDPCSFHHLPTLRPRFAHLNLPERAGHALAGIYGTRRRQCDSKKMILQL